MTGGSGQLGTLLVPRLLRDRRVAAVVSIDTRPCLLVRNKLVSSIADVRDPDIGRHFEGCDTVVHLAFLLYGYYRRALLEDVNVGGSRNVFQQATEAGVSHLVFCSSIAAYGVVPGHPLPLTEESRRVRQPEFGYAATKYDVEAFLDELERDHPSLLVSRIRPAILIGARMENPFGRMLQRRIIGDAGAPLPLVWDEDVADALARIVLEGRGGAFNLVAEEPLPARDLAAASGMRHLPMPPRRLARPVAALTRIGERLGLGSSIDPAWLTFASVPLAFSSRRAHDELGWRPRCPSVRDVVRHFALVVPRRTHRRIAWFFRAVDLASRFGPPRADLSGITLTIHLSLTGAEGGDFLISVAGGRVRILRHSRQPAMASVRMDWALFLRLLNGKVNWTQELLTGRIACEGHAHGAVVVTGIISSFRAQARASGVPAIVPRMLSRWLLMGETG